MSRIGKLPIKLIDEISCNIVDNLVCVKGSKGELSHKFTNNVICKLEKDEIIVKPSNDTKFARSMWGTARSIINSMVKGVCEGFKKELEVNGVGYKVGVNDDCLVMELGFSHHVYYKIPDFIAIKCNKNVVEISGCDKQLVGQVAAEIRSFRKPEPYKGKGIRYKGEKVRIKEGKKK